MRTETLQYLEQLRRRLDNERQTWHETLSCSPLLKAIGDWIYIDHLTRQQLRRESLAYPLL